MTAGRKRHTKNTPSHIDTSKLPTGVWYKNTGTGSWQLTQRDQYNRRHNIRLCGPTATLPEIWSAYENNQKTTTATFLSLSQEYQKTLMFRDLSPLTQKDYLYCHQAVCNRKTSNGKLGELPLKNWTRGLIRKYRDKRGEESKSRANKELSYIKLLFNWALEYEKIKENPATGISKLKVPPRQHYAEDKDYYYLLAIAKTSAYDYMPHAMELAYLCRMRLIEVLDFTDANETQDGLVINRRKNSRTNITQWEPRLQKIWDELKKRRNQILTDRKQPHPISPDKRHLFISQRTGNKLTRNAIETAMTRLKAAAKEKAKNEGIEFKEFTFHDLKRKGISDTEGDKLKASGHRSAAMLNIYDVKPEKVRPTR